MDDADNRKTAFLNRRDWASFVAALQSAATYPKVLEAVRSIQDSSWLMTRQPLREKLSLS